MTMPRRSIISSPAEIWPLPVHPTTTPASAWSSAAAYLAGSEPESAMEKARYQSEPAAASNPL